MFDGRFKEGDVLVELDCFQKWVVWYEDKYSYHLKSHDAVSEFRRAEDIRDCVQNYVKVGRWDFCKGMEICDEMDG